MCTNGHLLNTALLFSSGSSDSENSEAPSTSPNGNEVPSDPSPEGHGSDTQSPDSGAETHEKSYPIIGSISLDFSQIESGCVTILCGGSPMLTISLHFILAALSRSSRRKLASWLSKKELPAGFPIGNSSSPNANVTPTQDSEAAAGSHTADTASNPSGNSTPQSMLARKVARLLGIEVSNLSNSLCDSIRQLLKTGSLSFAVKNNILDSNSKNPGGFTLVSWSQILELGQTHLKSRRAANKIQKSGKGAVSKRRSNK